jgi:hypothetical protein
MYREQFLAILALVISAIALVVSIMVYFRIFV